MVYIAILLTLAGITLHALSWPLASAKARLENLCATREEIALTQDELMVMQQDLQKQRNAIAKHEYTITQGRSKLAQARSELANKLLIPAGLREDLNASFNLQEKLLDTLSGVLEHSHASITKAQHNLPAIQSTVHELYIETGKIYTHGTKFVARLDKKAHPLRKLQARR